MGLVVKIGADISKFEREFNRSTKLIQGVANGLISVGSKLTATVTMPILGIGAASVATAMDFDKSMSKVQAISGATGEDLDRLRSMAKEMGATTQFSAKESADALTYMGMAGWKTEDMISGLPGVLNLAAAGGTDLALTADIVTDGLTSMGLTANDTGMFVDIMAATCSNSNTSVELMGETLKYCGSTAGALGINMGDLSLAIGLMGNAGIKGSQAGTALRGGLTRLAKPTSEVSSAMKKYGIQLKTTKDGSVDLNGTMEELRKKLGGVTEVQQASALASIFGKEAMAGWASIVNASEEDFNKLKEAIAGSNGTAENMAKVMNDNLAGAMTTLKSSTEGLLIAIGERLTPYIRTFAEKLTEVTSALSSMSDEQLDLVIKIGLVVAAIGPLLMILGGLISFGLKVVSVWGMLSTAFATVSAAAATAGMSVAAFCAPVLIAIGVVVALAAAVVTNFGGIRDCISSVMSSVSSVIQSVLSFIKGLWESNFMGIQTYTIGVWNQIKLTFKTVFDAIRDIFNVFSKVFQGDWKGAWEAVKTLGVNIWNNIKSLFSNFLNTVVDTLLNIGVSLYTAARDAWDNVKRGAMEIWERVKAWFSQAVKDPIGTLKSIGSAMFNAGRDMINSVWDGCKSIWNSVKNWFSEKVNWIKDKLTFWKSSKAEMSDGDTRSRSALNQSAFNLQSSIVTANPIATRSSITRNNSITNNYNFYGNIGSNKNESFNVDKLAERLEFERRRASRATGGV